MVITQGLQRRHHPGDLWTILPTLDERHRDLQHWRLRHIAVRLRIATAKPKCLKHIVLLTNYWSDYGGMDGYVAQLNAGRPHNTLFIGATAIAAYET